MPPPRSDQSGPASGRCSLVPKLSWAPGMETIKTSEGLLGCRTLGGLRAALCRAVLVVSCVSLHRGLLQRPEQHKRLACPPCLAVAHPGYIKHWGEKKVPHDILTLDACRRLGRLFLETGSVLSLNGPYLEFCDCLCVWCACGDGGWILISVSCFTIHKLDSRATSECSA